MPSTGHLYWISSHISKNLKKSKRRQGLKKNKNQYRKNQYRK
jgi:hypothetical protein